MQIGNPGPDKWTARIFEDGNEQQMGIKGLENLGDIQKKFTIYSDSLYIVGSMTRSWSCAASNVRDTSSSR